MQSCFQLICCLHLCKHLHGNEHSMSVSGSKNKSSFIGQQVRHILFGSANPRTGWAASFRRSFVQGLLFFTKAPFWREAYGVWNDFVAEYKMNNVHFEREHILFLRKGNMIGIKAGTQRYMFHRLALRS